MKVFRNICKHCKKSKNEHLASNSACPIGTKTRIGFITFSPTQKFEAKETFESFCKKHKTEDLVKLKDNYFLNDEFSKTIQDILNARNHESGSSIQL